MPVRVTIPIRLRVDPAALTERQADVEEALAAAVGRALVNSRDVVLEKRGGYVGVRVHPPDISWYGDGLDRVTGTNRYEIEERITNTLIQAVKSAGILEVTRVGEQAQQPLLAEIVERIDRDRFSSVSEAYTLPSYQNAGEVTVPLEQRTGTSESPLPGIDTRTFAQLWDEFDRRRLRLQTRYFAAGLPILEDHNSDPLELVPSLLARMSPDDAFAHALDLALWLLYQGERSLAEQALSNLENSWWIRFIAIAGPDLPTSGGSPFGLLDPDQIIERAEIEARTNRHDLAQHLFRIAYLMSQMQLQQISQNRQRQGEQTTEHTDLNEVLGANHSLIIQGDLAGIRVRLNRILNFYPQLAQNALRSHDLEQARQLEEIGQSLSQELRERYTLEQIPELTFTSLDRPIVGARRRATPPQPTEITFEDETIQVVRDHVVQAQPPFQGALILQLPGNRYVFVHSDRYVITGTIARAAVWGRALFGTVSSVIIAPLVQPAAETYYVAGLSSDISISDLPPDFREGSVGGMIMGEIPHGFRIVAAIVNRGNVFLTQPGATSRLGQQLHSDQQEGRTDVPAELLRSNVFGEIDQSISLGGEENLARAAELLARLNVEAFRVIDRETRVRYLTILLNAWTFLAEERAIVEIIKSITSRSELDAVFAQIKQTPELWEKLFDDLDNELWSLLVVLGERFGGTESFSFNEFIQILLEARLLTVVPGISIGPNGPEIGVNALAEIEEAVRSALRTIEGFIDGIIMLIAHPDKIVEGIGQLIKMIVMFKLAELGYPPAQQFVGQLFTQMSRQVIFGLRGALVTGASQRFLRRIRWAIIWEVASLFVGVGEIQAALRALNITERAAAIARFVRLLGLAGRLAEGEQAATRISRFAALLSRSSRALRSEERALELLSHLPEEQATRLARALEGIEIDETTTLARLVQTNREVGELATASLRQAEALNELATKAGGLSTEVVEAFQRLTRAHGNEVGDIIRHIPSGQGASFARAMRAIPQDVALGGRASSDMLRALAESPTRMDALSNLGYDAFSVIYTRVGRNPQTLDNYLESLTRIHGRLPRETRAIEFRELLENLARNEARAWERLEAEASSVPRHGATSPLTRILSREQIIEEEIAQLGVNPETQELLRTNETLRRSLLEHPFAARALRRCSSPCFFPPNATPEQIAQIDRLLRRVSGGEVDYDLLTHYFHSNRDRLQEAINFLDQRGSTAADINAKTRFYYEGRTPTQLPSRMDLAAAVERAHEHGVRQGSRTALREGLNESNFVNPFEYRGRYGQGFDDIRVHGSDLYRDEIYIVEYKGGGATLDPGQMELEWVWGNIQRLHNEGGAPGQRWAAILEQAAREGRLKGVAYSSPFIGLTKRVATWTYRFP